MIRNRAARLLRESLALCARSDARLLSRQAVASAQGPPSGPPDALAGFHAGRLAPSAPVRHLSSTATPPETDADTPALPKNILPEVSRLILSARHRLRKSTAGPTAVAPNKSNLNLIRVHELKTVLETAGMDPTLWKKPEMVNRLYAHVEFLKRQLTIAQADAAAAQPAGPAPGSLPPGVVTKKLSEFEAMRRAAAASSEPATPAAVLGVAEKHLCDMRCRDVCVIDLTRREGFAPADAVVLATVDSPEQVWASAGGLMYQLRVTFPGESWAHTHMYGSEGSDWVCIDLGRTMVNVLTQEGREYYDIEGQWADADGGNVRRVAGAPPPSAPQQSIADLAD